MGDFVKGEWVAYVPGDGRAEFGRVASVTDDGDPRICFTEGCTAATTPKDMVLKAEPGTFDPNLRIGHHRFDDFCPDYDEECCAAFCPEKGGV